MREAAIVLDKSGSPLHIHTPEDRTAVKVPDSLDLWTVLWDNMENLSGVAHSHPGYGLEGLGPSYEDVTTFQPCEAALGRLDWWIANGDSLILVRWVGPDLLDYAHLPVLMEPPWVHTLRKISGYL